MLSSPNYSGSCEACTSDDDPLVGEELGSLYERIDTDVWGIVDEHYLEGNYEFEDFRDALEFTYEIGALAEAEWHHPDIHHSRPSTRPATVEPKGTIIDGSRELFQTDVRFRIRHVVEFPDSRRDGVDDVVHLRRFGLYDHVEVAGDDARDGDVVKPGQPFGQPCGIAGGCFHHNERAHHRL